MKKDTTNTQKPESNYDTVMSELEQAVSTYPIVKTKDIYTHARAHGYSYNSAKETFMHSGPKRGEWDMRNVCLTKPTQKKASVAQPQQSNSADENFKFATSVQSVSNDDVYIPEVDPNFISWGDFSKIKKIIDSKQFFPLYISGMSGNGKTMMVEQACAKAKREYVRVQISPETDEDDLIGGFRLINGETVFQKGPVLKAMEAGCILLIDEMDRGSNKIMCLQGVLEGKPVMVKKTGGVVHPAPGFNVIATANTKGRGADDGRYSAAQIIDDAFVERFVASIDQPFPAYNVELKIIKKHMTSCDVRGHDDFADKLVSWGAVIRKTYESEGVDELISTRRLCHIVKALSIFNNRLEAIKMCITRFEDETKEAFLDLYTKIDTNQIDKDMNFTTDENSTDENSSDTSQH
jgi:cobaltochelatase CobS